MSKRKGRVRRLKPGEIKGYLAYETKIRVAADVECHPMFHEWGVLDFQPTCECLEDEHTYGIIVGDACCYQFNDTDYEIMSD